MINKAWSYHRSKTGKNEWLTPLWLIHGLGKFDLDPCAPVNRPWNTAKEHYTIIENGLYQSWHGRVWLNPPYSEWGKWLAKLVLHGNGIALIFARTETQDFFRYVWEEADAILFIKGRLTFHHQDGSKARYNSGAGSCLIAYGTKNVQSLIEIPKTPIIKQNLNGKLIILTEKTRQTIENLPAQMEKQL